jgi:methylated-DNA-[protein]-cysteine S-methyltransferase
MATSRTNGTPSLFAPFHAVVVQSPIGKVWVESDGAFITRLSFSALPVRASRPPLVLQQAQRQLKAYFAGTLKEFDLPVQQLGTRFQKLVWEALTHIPHGHTRSYQAIGADIGGKALGRTVGHACGSNPIPIIVPCHRVIASDGLLTGYVGGLWRKKWLLEHEGALPKEVF